MNRQWTPLSRLAGLVVGVVAAAAFGGSVAASAATVSASHTGARVAACATSQLRVWYGEPPSGTAGSFYLPLEFSDIGTTSCTLYGFPGVSGIKAGGAQLGSPASWDHRITPRTVLLTPGSTAHVILQIVDVANYPANICGPTQAFGLRIYPPNQKASVELPFAFEACATSGPNYLRVDPVSAGVGIPLYTSN